MKITRLLKRFLDDTVHGLLFTFCFIGYVVWLLGCFAVILGIFGFGVYGFLKVLHVL